MYHKALSIYYGLSIFVLGAGFLVLHPSSTPEMTIWQNDIKHQVVTAWKQTIGDQPWFEEVGLIYDGVNNFYTLASDETIAVLDQEELNSDVVMVFEKVYTTFANSFRGKNNTDSTAIAYKDLPLPAMPDNFMTEEPIYNIVPYRTVVKTVETGAVAGAEVDLTSPVNIGRAWVTIQDNYTGQLYCLAIYNNEINKYLGPCKNEYY
ncbi:MAG: hypothetical protein KW804_03525 [Candidatus Doudnabacteria bacterium]|nr:hypothetical protein [Candidatus Doudnabacteria bacterium]